MLSFIRSKIVFKAEANRSQSSACCSVCRFCWRFFKVTLAPGVRCFCSLQVRIVSLFRDVSVFDEMAGHIGHAVFQLLTPGQVLDVITSSTHLLALRGQKCHRVSLRAFDKFQTGSFIWQQNEEQTLWMLVLNQRDILGFTDCLKFTS